MPQNSDTNHANYDCAIQTALISPIQRFNYRKLADIHLCGQTNLVHKQRQKGCLSGTAVEFILSTEEQDEVYLKVTVIQAVMVLPLNT